MFGNETCPRCMSPIAEERANSIPKVCDGCGHVLTASESQTKKQLERNSLKWVIGSSAVIVLAFMQLVSWGGHSLEVIPLQVGGLIGMSSPEGIERMAQICLETKKYDCVESNYIRSAAADINGYKRLGKFQYNRMKYAEAAQSLHAYFTRGGADDLDARYVYARALSQSGQVEVAAQQYDVLIAAKPDVLPITVAQHYVKMLVEHGKLEQALKVIDTIRRRDESVAMFMDTEYREIAQKLGRHS